MRNFLWLAGLVMAAALTSCVENKKAPSPETLDDGESLPTKTVEIDGERGEVDAFVLENYTKIQIKEALRRDAFVSKATRPQDATTFGRKQAQVVWRAFTPLKKEVGQVTVTYYEKGVQVTKDGKSWFYDQIKRHPSDLWHLSATESVLHHGVWEPVYVNFAIGDYLRFVYAYTCGCEEEESFCMWEYELLKADINSLQDLKISETKY